MQKKKLSPQKLRGAQIFTLSSFFLASALLIQPLGLSAAWNNQQEEVEKLDGDDWEEGTGSLSLDSIEYDGFEPELYHRSYADYFYDSQLTEITTMDDFEGENDPDDDDLPVPEGYNPVDEIDPGDLEPIVKPQGLSYTDADYILYIKANTLNLRAGPSTDATVVATLKFGDKVTCEGENDDWMKVRYDGKIGFLKTEYTSKTMVFKAVNETWYVDSNTLKLRAGPSINDEVVATLKKNDKLTCTGMGDGWSLVKTTSGKKGYVASQYLTKTAPVIRTVRKSTSSSSSTSSKSGTVYSGNAGKIVELAYQALGVRYVGGSESLSGMDCTGLTYWAYRQIGISVPRSTGGYYQAGAGVSYSNIRPGDVICWDAHPRDGRTTLSHVGIYVGNGQMIHASSRLGRVVLQSVSEYRSWGCKIITIRRFVSG
ncbi:MAG: SH3 domain-containing protein [Clostridia bacterium]|nr:SH3 domain-containing protein [Clostridia bacterium]